MKSIYCIILLFVCLQSLSSQESEILSRKTVLELDRNKLVRTDSIVLQINEQAGDDDAEIYLYYSKGESVSNIEAWLEDKDGNIIRKLKGKDILTRSAISSFSLYEDDFVKVFSFKHSTYPYRIFYTYKYTSGKDIVMYNFGRQRMPVRSVNVKVKTLLPIIYRQKYIDEPTILKLEKVNVYEWQFSYDGYKPEVDASYKNNTDFPELSIQPLNFNFYKEGSLESWRSFGNWEYSINEGRDVLPDSEKRIIDNLLKGVSDDKEKAKILYKYLQDNTRYINITVKYGGLLTYPAEYVCANRYGDCKALTNYMKAMLSYVGVKSYYTSVFLGERFPEIYSDYPDASVFNHVILTIPFGNDTTFLECTSKNNPFGYVSTNLHGRKALLSDKENSKLVEIPNLTPEQVLCSRTIRLDIDGGDADVNISSIEKGASYELLNSYSVNADKNTMDKYIRNIYSGNLEIREYDVAKNNADSANVSFAISCKMYGISKKYGNNIIINPVGVYLPVYESPLDREFGVLFNYPLNRKDTIIYNISGVTMSKIPSDVSIESRYGKYSIEYKLIDNALYIYKHLLINSGRYEVEEYIDFYNFISQIKKIDYNKIYIEE